MTAKEQVLNICNDAFISVGWMPRTVSVKRKWHGTYLCDDFETEEEAWEAAWLSIQRAMLQKLESD